MTTTTFFSTKDADSQSGATLTNATTTTTRIGTSYVSYGNLLYQSFYQMDFSSLDPNLTIVSAVTLQITVGTAVTGAGQSITGYLNTGTWAETNSTAAPTYDNTTTTAAIDCSTTGNKTSTDALWVTWVQNWVQGITTNNGFMLGEDVVLSGTGKTNGTVDAREFTGTTSDPQMSVTYITTAKFIGATMGPSMAAIQRSVR